jgi:hypothetical protein
LLIDIYGSIRYYFKKWFSLCIWKFVTEYCYITLYNHRISFVCL